MSRAALVVMAAGLGSRFGGGIKQLEPVGPNREIIMEYSIYDAVEAGFDKVVFVIRRDIETDFREAVGKRLSRSWMWPMCTRRLKTFRQYIGSVLQEGQSHGGQDRRSSVAGMRWIVRSW